MDYDRYMELVPKAERKDRMPRTPNKNRKYSRRQWDGLVKNWKQQIHATVNALDGVDDDVDSMESDWKLDGRLSSAGSWAEEVEAEDEFHLRGRARSSASSDQVSYFEGKYEDNFFVLDFQGGSLLSKKLMLALLGTIATLIDAAVAVY